VREILDIQRIEEYYDITEEGLVYSKVRKRWLKPQKNNCNYTYYYLTYPYKRWVYAHTLVALKYIGAPSGLKFEVNHKDCDRMNNHYSNLEWVTHSQNQLLAYKSGRVCWWKHNERPSVALETRIKMSNAKKKRVRVGGDVYESVGDACVSLRVSRRCFNRRWVLLGVEVVDDSLGSLD